jgi:hypothetical protein
VDVKEQDLVINSNRFAALENLYDDDDDDDDDMNINNVCEKIRI